jgi:hypothetical protein
MKRAIPARYRRKLIVALFSLALVTVIFFGYSVWNTKDAISRIEAVGGRVTKHETYPPWYPVTRLPVTAGKPLAHKWYDVQFARRPVSDRDILPLADLAGLEVLELHTTQVTGSGLSSLRNHTELRHLFLNNNPIEDDSLAHLENLHNLEWVELQLTKITDDGLRHLLPLKKLRRLELYGTAITDDAVPILGQMTSLQEMRVDGTKITDAGRQELKARLPNCTILP